jgi:hypothetical protein
MELSSYLKTLRRMTMSLRKEIGRTRKRRRKRKRGREE